MTALRLATWNVNSVRLRLPQVERFLAEAQPDVLCLQEIKCNTGEFPSKAFKDAGYPHLVVRGQKGLHGVAIASRLPIEAVAEPDHCREGHARVSVAKVAGVEIHNYYAPAGGDEPDPFVNPRFAHKLDFWARLADWSEANAERFKREPVVVMGDLNIAPGENDVHSHKRLLTQVGHTPIETAAYAKARTAGGFLDIARALRPEPEKVFTWWSYRVKAWSPESPGWRLDHVWTSPALGQPAKDAVTIRTDIRGWDKPSDHVPVITTLKV